MKRSVLAARVIAAAFLMGALPATAQNSGQTFDGDYEGSLSGGFSGSMKFKVGGGGKLAGEARGTIDGRAFEGKIGGTIGGGADAPFSATVSGTLKAKPDAGGGGGVSGTFPAQPFNGLQVTYSVTGVKTGPHKDSEGFTNSRIYQVDGASGPVTVSGSAVANTATCNSEYGSFWFQTDATLSVGGKSASFSSPAPCTRQGATEKYTVQQPAAQFNLSLPAPTGTDSSINFSIRQTYVNPRFGNRGVVVGGGKQAIGDEQVSLALTGKLTQAPTRKNPRAVFSGTYAGKAAGQDVKGDWQAKGGACAGGRRPDGSCPGGIELQVCPSAKGGFSSTGLIAGADGARAVLRYRGSPNAKVKVSYASSGIHVADTVTDFKIGALPMERAEVAYAKDLPAELSTDGKGELTALLFFRAINNVYLPNQSLDRPATVKFAFAEAGDSDGPATVDVQVGLGVTLQHKMAAIESPGDAGPHHAWRAYAESRFHPGLDLAAYVEGIKTCGASVSVPIVNVQSVWLNQDNDGVPFNDGIGGPGTAGTSQSGTDQWRSSGHNLGFARSKNAGKTYLTVPAATRRSDHPVHAARGDELPAVTQLRDGHFIKAYWAYIGMDNLGIVTDPSVSTNAAAAFLGSAGTIEPRVLDRAAIVLSKDDPERWYTSAACMFEPQDGLQLAWTMWAKMIPGFGGGYGKFETVMEAMCTMARGKIRDGLQGLAKDLARDKFIDIVKNHYIGKTSYALVKGECPPAVYRLVGVDPVDPQRMPQAFTKWKQVMEMEVDAVIDQYDNAGWQPPAAGAPPPSASRPPAAPVAVPAPSAPAQGQWGSIGGGSFVGQGSSATAPAPAARPAPAVPPAPAGGGSQALW